MNQHFNTDGPIQVSEEDFQKYKSLPTARKALAFEDLFDIWTEKEYSKGVRRLALRDMLRQTYSTSPYYNKMCHNVKFNFSRILQLHNSPNPAELCWCLMNRPCLLQELIEEFKYLLKSPASNLLEDRIAKHTILEIIFRIADEDTGRELLPYYDIFNPADYTSKDADKLINEWSNSRNPQWLRDTLYRVVDDTLTREINSIHDELIKHPRYSFGTYCKNICCHIPFIDSVSRIFFLHIHAEPPYEYIISSSPLIIFLNLIKKSLPKGTGILPYEDLIPILYHIDDPKLTLSYLKLHLLSTSDNHIEEVNFREATHFLYWAEGFIHRHNSGEKDAPELLQAIDTLRATVDKARHQ